eukprot:TRINITY_DN12077_c0_g1_i9.p1 TRINITY_DN12077_c0_g1~~TRINITY_DN12077_c0_g1_i9.p1  ORF type:complete len:193 (-),score=60.40 TRINITY_DN12077_c0_g1_i9:91-669(-)
MEKEENCEILKEADGLPDVMFKLIVIGEASVGKSCILVRAAKDEYREEYEVTVGAESSTIYMKINNKISQLQIWDTAGMEKFRSMIKVFFNGSHGAFIVFDITRKATFDLLDVWLSVLRDNTTPDIKVIVIGNKIDLQEKREVTPEMGKEYVMKNGLYEYIAVSYTHLTLPTILLVQISVVAVSLKKKKKKK